MLDSLKRLLELLHSRTGLWFVSALVVYNGLGIVFWAIGSELRVFAVVIALISFAGQYGAIVHRNGYWSILVTTVSGIPCIAVLMSGLSDLQEMGQGRDPILLSKVIKGTLWETGRQVTLFGSWAYVTAVMGLWTIRVEMGRGDPFIGSKPEDEANHPEVTDGPLAPLEGPENPAQGNALGTEEQSDRR